jgi:hypothetical protein
MKGGVFATCYETFTCCAKKLTKNLGVTVQASQRAFLQKKHFFIVGDTDFGFST